MLTPIDPLFKSLFRHVEESDAKKSMRREERIYKRAQDRENAPHKSAYYTEEDHTEVSVKAMISFLKDMLEEDVKSFRENAFSTTEDDGFLSGQSPPSQSQEVDKKPTFNAAQASQAYKNTADKIEAPFYKDEPSSQSSNMAGSHVVTVEKENKALIKNFIEKLEKLSENNQHTISISRSGTFFKSLGDALDQ